MNKHYFDPNLYITCIMCNVNKMATDLDLKISCVDYVFICIDIDIYQK